MTELLSNGYKNRYNRRSNDPKLMPDFEQNQ